MMLLLILCVCIAGAVLFPVVFSAGCCGVVTVAAYSSTEAAAAASHDNDKVLRVNPVLEAFGNAKTIRNNNSSRFGRWMTVHFDDRAQICGSKIDNYLLEKSRVTNVAQGERNFHVFYMLLAGESASRRSALHLTRATEYAYLFGGGCVEVRVCVCVFSLIKLLVTNVLLSHIVILTLRFCGICRRCCIRVSFFWGHSQSLLFLGRVEGRLIRPTVPRKPQSTRSWWSAP